MPVSSPHSCTAVRHGPHVPGRRGDSIPSSWEASIISLAYPGKTGCLTLRSCPEPTFQACSPCSDSAGCVGWGMSTAWRMAASKTTFSMESWHLEGEQRPATAELQGWLQEKHESTWHQHRVLGGPCSRPHDVERHSEPTPQVRGKVWTNTSDRGKVWTNTSDRGKVWTDTSSQGKSLNQHLRQGKSLNQHLKSGEKSEPTPQVRGKVWTNTSDRGKVWTNTSRQGKSLNQHLKSGEKSEPTPQVRGREAGECWSRKKGLQKGAQQL